MGMEGRPLSPQACRLDIDAYQGLKTKQRTGAYDPGDARGGHRPATQHQGGIKDRAITLDIPHMYAEGVRAHHEAPVMELVHAVERTDVKTLGEYHPQRCARGMVVRHRMDIDLAFEPRGVGDLGDDGCQPTIAMMAEIERYRIETETGTAWQGDELNGPGGDDAGFGLHHGPHAVVQGAMGWRQIISAMEPQQGRTAESAPGMAFAGAAMVQIETDHAVTIAEIMAYRRMATVAYPTDVGVIEVYHVAPRRVATRTPLTTPSSWKPQPQ